MQSKFIMKISPLALLLALFLSACGGLAGEPEVVGRVPTRVPQPEQQSVALTIPNSAPDLAQGAEIFAERCTDCHGETGAGDGSLVLSGSIDANLIPDFTDPADTAGDTPEQYYEAVTNGNLAALMPPFSGSLSDEERWAVANYVLTLDGDNSDVAVAAPADSNDDAADSASAASDDESAAADDPHAGIDMSSATTETDPNDPHAGLDIAAVEDAEPITVSGSLSHGTEGGTLPEETTALLRIITMNGEEQRLETTVGADGVYTFNDVPFNPQAGYFVSVRYGDNAFNSEFVSGEALVVEDIALDVTVFDTTSDASVMQFNYVLTQVDRLEDGSLQIWQAYNLTNTSDRVFMQQEANGHNVSVGLPIPANAQLVSASDQSRFFPDTTNGVLYDMMPVRPNSEHSFHVVYNVPAGNNYTLEQTFPYDFAGPFEAYSNAEFTTLSGDGITELGQQTINDVTYTGMGMIVGPAAGETIRLNVRSNGGGLGDLLSNQVVAYGLMVLGAVLVVAAAALLFVGRGGGGDAPSVGGDVQARIQALVSQIADLDDKFQSDGITKKEYDERRGALKDELTTLMNMSD